jgi:hypothetical protein
MYAGITKEVNEDISFEMIQKRLYPIFDSIGHDAVTIKETHYIWGKGSGRTTHHGFEIEYKDNSEQLQDDWMMKLLKLGAFVYAINKEFKGAKAVLTINDKTFPVYYGAENALEML